MESLMYAASPCGRIMKTRTRYDAFVPAPLPPALSWNGAVRETIEQAGESLSRFTRKIEDRPDFMELVLRVDALHAAGAEGAQCTLRKLFEAEAGGGRSAAGARLGINYVAAFNHARERLSELPLSLRLIREIHYVLADGVAEPRTTPGYFRTSQNWIGPAGCSLNEARFVPPPPEEMRELLHNWEQYIHMVDDTPALARVAIAHYQLLTLHPFLALNLALAALTVNYVLWQTRLTDTPTAIVGAFAARRAPEFVDQALELSRTGAWDKWLLYYTTGLMRAAIESSEALRRFRNVTAEDDATLDRTQADGATRRAAELLRQHPAISPHSMAEAAGLSLTEAQNAIERLSDLGLAEWRDGGVTVAPRIIAALEPQGVDTRRYGVFF